MWKMKKREMWARGERRLLFKPPAIVAVSQSGASGQDFFRDSIGGKFY